MVGAVLARDGEIVGEAFHHRTGEAHAEILALAAAGARARGATLEEGVVEALKEVVGAYSLLFLTDQ